MRAVTRRGFVSGAVAAAVLPAPAARAAHAGPASGPIRAEGVAIRRGRAIAVDRAGSRLVVAHDQRRSVAIAGAGGRDAQLVDAGGQPVAVALAPDGATAVAATAFWDEPGIAFLDAEAASVLRRVEVGPAPYDIAFTPDGGRVVVSGGEQEGTVHVVEAAGGVLVTRRLGTLPRGVAVAAGGASAWIVLAGVNRVVEVDLADGRVRRSLSTPPLPERVALSPDGARLLVSHTGLDAARVSEISIASGGVTRREVGRQPAAVAWAEGGERVVCVGGAGEVVVLDDGGVRARHRVGGAPRGVAVAGGSAWTVDSLSGKVSEVSL